MLKNLSARIYLWIILGLSLSGCSAVRGIGDALLNSFKGFSVSFPAIHFP
jgi:hypothetical protein